LCLRGDRLFAWVVDERDIEAREGFGMPGVHEQKLPRGQVVGLYLTQNVPSGAPSTIRTKRSHERKIGVPRYDVDGGDSPRSEWTFSASAVAWPSSWSTCNPLLAVSPCSKTTPSCSDVAASLRMSGSSTCGHVCFSRTSANVMRARENGLDLVGVTKDPSYLRKLFVASLTGFASASYSRSEGANHRVGTFRGCLSRLSAISRFSSFHRFRRASRSTRTDFAAESDPTFAGVNHRWGLAPNPPGSRLDRGRGPPYDIQPQLDLGRGLRPRVCSSQPTGLVRLSARLSRADPRHHLLDLRQYAA
jgi:hypothetical protein